MLEMMLTRQGTSNSNYPDSGPGTKTLQFGNTSTGYFGEVTAAEMLTGGQTYVQAGLTLGNVVVDSTLVWLKFYLDNKVLFVAKQQVAIGVTWLDLYNAGVVYGEKGNGLYPATTPVDQFKYVVVPEGSRKWALKFRLLRGFNVDPSATAGAADFNQSEWNRLMLRVVRTIDGGIAPVWANNTYSQICYANDMKSWVMETYGTNVNYAWMRGSSTNTSTPTTWPKNDRAGGYMTGWRPVLELISIDDLAIDPKDVDYDDTGLIAPSIVSDPDQNQDLINQLVNVSLVDWRSDAPIAPAIVEVVIDPSLDYALNPTDVTWSSGLLNEFGLDSDSANTIPQQQYVWSVAPLDEFGFTTDTI